MSGECPSCGAGGIRAGGHAAWCWTADPSLPHLGGLGHYGGECSASPTGRYNQCDRCLMRRPAFAARAAEPGPPRVAAARTGGAGPRATGVGHPPG